MTERLRVHAVMPDDVSSFPGIQVVEGETQPQQVVL